MIQNVSYWILAVLCVSQRLLNQFFVAREEKKSATFTR